MANTDLQGSSLKDFLLTKDVKDKRDTAYGKVVAKDIASLVFGTSGYFFNRNVRFAKNRRWGSGRIDVRAMFQDRLEMEGKTNYANLSWKCLFLVSTIISRLVGRWMTRNEKISVTATDTLSITQKNEQYEEIQFELENRKALQELEQAAGVPLTPQDQFRPQDKEELDLWREEIQMLPEEILYETNINDALDANGWSDVLKEKALRDAAEVGLVATETWMDEEGVIHVDYVLPENTFYSYSNYPDFRDTTCRGIIKSLKISEIRKKYGLEFGGKLTEEEIFKIACQCKEYQTYDKITWTEDWAFGLLRPYDEWNYDALVFEIKTLDSDGYTITKTKTNKSTLVKRGKPEKLDDNQEYIEDNKLNIYRGVYLQGIDILLEWGLKKNMIRPQDPKESGNCEFSFSFYMYQAYKMTNVAVPEKIEEPVEQMILTRLKMEQLVAKMKPAGAAINVDAMQELDLGLSKTTKPWDAKKIWEQTGDLFYRGRDAEGNPIPVPVTELANAGFIGQMQALIALYQFHYGVLKEELGEDPNLMAQAATPRVSVGNIQTARQEGDLATGYMADAVVRVLEDTAKKMSCLMYKSVRYGSKAYRDVMNEENVKDRIFGTKIQLLPNQYEVEQLQALLNQAIASTPDLVMYMDVFKIMRLAKENIKLAEAMFQQCQKRMIREKAEQATKNAQENAQIQMQSAQSKAEGDMKLKELEGQIKMEASTIDEQAKSKNTALAGIMKLLEVEQTTGMPMRPDIRTFSQVVLETVGLAALIENAETRQAIAQKMQQQAMAAQQQQMQEPGVGQQEQAPPEEMAQMQQQPVQPEMAA